MAAGNNHMGATMAGYSGTPLPKKLGIKAGNTILLLNAPPGFYNTLGDMPENVKSSNQPGKGPNDVILFFTRSRRQFEMELPRLRRFMAPACGLWICWPKQASKVATDITEDVVRSVALPAGLVDNKVCAVDDTWSGLRLVIRVENR